MINQDALQTYGVYETNGMTEHWHDFRENIDRSQRVSLNDPRLARVVRLRLLTDPGFPYWDLSYCYGELKDGTKVTVDLPVHQFRKGQLKGDLIAMAKREGVFAKGLGLLDSSVISTLC